MLIQFSVQNFKTFKEKATLSLIASNYDKATRATENISETNNYKLKLLKSAVIYGANASGKTKLIEALGFMRYFVVNSSKGRQSGEKIPVEPFLLSSETEQKASEFEIVFIHKQEMYRYGFEADSGKIVSEWLYHKPKKKEVELFRRNFQEFETHAKDFKKGTALVDEKMIRDNALLISTGAQFNDSTCINVIQWFLDLKIISGLREEEYRGYTLSKTGDTISKEKILELLKAAGMFTSHKKGISNIDFSLDDDESTGTRKFFYLTAIVLNALKNGYQLIIDELGSNLHPNLVAQIVSLFNSQKLNPNDAQLIFNTHDTNLLSSNLFRKDQIWFTEKDKYGATKLYSLADFKSGRVRKKEAFEDNYIRGKYGAVPLNLYCII